MMNNKTHKNETSESSQVSVKESLSDKLDKIIDGTIDDALNGVDPPIIARTIDTNSSSKTEKGNQESNPFLFHSNSRYFTICIYGLFFVALATLIIMLIINWQNTSDLISSFFSAITPFIIAFFIAYILNPFVKWVDYLLQKYIFKKRLLKGRRFFSIAIVYIIVLATITLAMFYIIPEIINSVKDIEGVSKKINVTEISKDITDMLEDLQLRYPEFNFKIVEDRINEMVPLLLSMSTSLLSDILSISFSIVRTLINILLAIVISCYMLSDKQTLTRNTKRVLYSILSKKRADSIVINTRECNIIFSKFIIGKSIDSLIIGILCFIIMSILQLPYAILFSVIVGITNMIPYFGPFIGAIPGVVIYLLINPFNALVFSIMIFLLQQFDGLYLGPKILGESTGLTPLWVIFGITLGGAYAGVLGMFLGVPITAVIAYLLNKFLTNRLNKKNITIDS